MLKLKETRKKYDKQILIRILLDQNLNILLANKEAISFFEWENEYMIGKNILVYCSYRLRSLILPKLTTIFNSKNEIDSFNDKLTASIKIDKNYIINIVLKPIKKIFHYPDKAFSIISISIIKSVNIKNISTSTPKYIHNISHELRAPLFNIISFLETLYEYNNQLSINQKLELIEIAINETNRLNKLVNDILDFSKLENQKNYELSKISICNLIEEVLKINQFTAINKKLILIKKVDNKNTKMVITDYNLTFRVVSNLLNNAIKFTYPNGIIKTKIITLHSINLSKYCRKNRLRISVTDDGIGILRKDLKIIFNRFSSTSNHFKNIKGSGLGLPIVKEILLKQNEKLSLSTYRMKGTNVCFNLDY